MFHCTGDPAGIAMHWTAIKPEKLIEPPVGWHDMEKALVRCKPTVSQEDLVEMEDWTLKFGQEG